MSNRDDQFRQDNPGGYSTGNTPRIADGMTVYDVNGDKIGKVSGYTASGNYFKLEKGLLFPRDYYVPMSAVRRVDPDGVYLNVRKDDIENLGWDNPPVAGQQRHESLGDRVRDTLNPNDEPRP